MASSSSSSSSSSSYSYDVFPSFRGADVRVTFLSHLLKEFDRVGITTFRDSKIRTGKSINPELVKAIRESKISIVVFSKKYATSSWCLDELVQILECRETKKVMTIFYQVDPSHVRKQRGIFGRNFKKFCRGKTAEQKAKWRQALIYAANIRGVHSKRWDNEAKMIENIAVDISNELNDTPSRDFDGFVGIQDHLAKMYSILCLPCDDVRMVGIWGPAGIGKTTIARALFHQISGNFDFAVFLESVKGCYRRTKLDDYGLKVRLQKRLLSVDQHDTREWNLGVVKERLKNKKVLVVLDDVDDVEQLNALAEGPHWFGSGSRVIVTTEDKQVLRAHNVDNMYKVGFPSEEQALEIFCQYAFGQSSPEDGFMELALDAAKYAGYLPLGLRIVGSYLRGKSKDEWLTALSRLRTSLHGNIQKILINGYNSLHEKDKAIFLHLACMFNGEKKDKIVDLLDNSNLDVRQGLLNLEEQSLVEKSTDTRISMHYLLQLMGRGIVRSQSTKLGKRQFLVDTKEIFEVLSHNKGTEAVLGISLNLSELTYNLDISQRTFEGLSNLLFLRFYNNPAYRKVTLHSISGLVSLPNTLRLVHWDACPLEAMPSEFRPQFLVKLSLPNSKLKKLWEGKQPLGSLKLMDLSFSMELKEVPDLSEATKLEKLDLSQCESLVTLPSSIGGLSKLNDLIMWGCKSIKALPQGMDLESLKSLYMSGCSELEQLPQISTNVKYLSLGKMSTKFWSGLGRGSLLGSETEHSFSQALKSVQTLRLSGNDFKRIPDCIKDLSNLRELFLVNCRKLISLPELPESLVVLYAENCESLKEISHGFKKSNIVLDFVNCLKLDKEARDIIQQSVCKYAFLPFEEVPADVTHQASGSSLTVYLDQRPLSEFSGFKAYVVLAEDKGLAEENGLYDGVISCSFRGRVGGPVWKHEVWMRYPSELKRNHLCVFDYVLPEKDHLEAQMCQGEILFEFSCTLYNIIRCGIRLDPKLKSFNPKYRGRSTNFGNIAIDETSRRLKSLL